MWGWGEGRFLVQNLLRATVACCVALNRQERAATGEILSGIWECRRRRGAGIQDPDGERAADLGIACSRNMTGGLCRLQAPGYGGLHRQKGGEGWKEGRGDSEEPGSSGRGTQLEALKALQRCQETHPSFCMCTWYLGGGTYAHASSCVWRSKVDIQNLRTTMLFVHEHT